MAHLVTKDSLRNLLNDEKLRQHVIGRALCGLLEYQTRSEQATASTNEWNYVGFNHADAKGGTLTAKYYAKHKSLLDWQINKWMKIGKSGYPRLCKYWKQLDHIAKLKAEKTSS